MNECLSLFSKADLGGKFLSLTKGLFAVINSASVQGLACDS